MHRSMLSLLAVAVAASPEIHVIDISRIVAGRGSAEDLDLLRESCLSPGFFHITHHGIPEQVTRDFDDVMRSFFALPQPEKDALRRTRDNAYGYADDELTKTTRDCKEVFDYGHMPAGRGVAADDAANCVLDGHNQLPSSLPGFHAAIGAYYDACSTVAGALLRAVAASLGLADGTFDDAFGAEHTSFLRMNRYPLVAGEGRTRFDDNTVNLDQLGPAAANATLGVNRHTDAGGFTLLRQDDAVSSLQVNVNFHDAASPPQWIDVSPVPGALTVNVGDMLQVLSNGRYKAPEHRVLASAIRERYSAPFFYNPSFKAIIAPRPPLESCASYGPPFTWHHFRSNRFLGDFENTGKPDIQIEDYRLAACGNEL
ncbi:hypothetical protein M885DRAFT_517325 [Pelagophyceae sp. CCMP2097]|nr:hypothetical protein M885DRAFT_517325 [Pelagophyceae sp. CCMP2097]